MIILFSGLLFAQLSKSSSRSGITDPTGAVAGCSTSKPLNEMPCDEPPTKKQHSTLFAHYNKPKAQVPGRSTTVLNIPTFTYCNL